jgi:DNA (cytosine-5)-methyltransferase 1
MKKLRYFSTFTGIGGLDMGLEKRGAECVGYSEIKASSIEIYSRHYPHHKNYGDITKINPKELPDFDVFCGGFPCQAFSMAGARKGFSDRRGQMIFYIYDILVEKKPEFLVLENVKGISTHNGGETYQNVFKVLQAAGYNVRVVLLNSAHYGSAQARERVVFLGRRDKDFAAKNPEVRDNTKRFRDVRGEYGAKDVLSERTMQRLEATGGLKGFELVGGYDRVNTLTTGISSSGRRMLVTQEENGTFRRITAREAELLQGFPEGWTEGSSTAKRWFALGNAVNCNVSDYLFNDYLVGLWWDK